ncbi:Divalent-cation tolerance protein CutA [bacterium HR20]|jgi:periplasmic divalent cation tolerance protein|nr:Divalent-cation tolerance protein CutA [bacterium HR20]
MEDTASVALVLTTISTEEHAETLARQLLEERLIACSTVIGAASSHYWWGGAITSETEAVLLLKTRSDLVEQLRQRILELHPYNVPEVIVLQPSAVSDAYAAWVEESTKPRQN